jgi:hypothetical protein
VSRFDQNYKAAMRAAFPNPIVRWLYLRLWDFEIWWSCRAWCAWQIFRGRWPYATNLCWHFADSVYVEASQNTCNSAAGTTRIMLVKQ